MPLSFMPLNGAISVEPVKVNLRTIGFEVSSRPLGRCSLQDIAHQPMRGLR